ncbi:hypothetical protein AB0I06_29190 [Streptomyces sp. NPDC050674]|uniref:hypothetical protein n=1 Tax=Streptomyces sp. NPDC050674 TaxID=3157216 RepID=UPI00343940CD
MDSGAIRRRLALGLTVLTASGLLAVAVPGEAQAATTALCPGRKVRTLPFSTGTVLVYKRGGYVCAVTLPKWRGAKRTMSVSVQARGNRPVVDAGQYARHAGPVTVHAGRRCVWLKGQVGRGKLTSGWIMC